MHSEQENNSFPAEFLERMKEMLGEEYPAFFESLGQERQQSFRINTGKTSVSEFLQQTDWKLKPVPWCETGFYYGKEIRPGKHPYHNAGVYYIQEPSAMVPAECLKAQPGDIILDLCAAPGGKSTQIAAAMKGKGILICNEIHPARAKILSENIERMGIKNALVLNETPEQLAERFPVCFDKIMVDAPCSGEGMFRKNEEAGNEWSLDNVKLCANRQDGILDCAYEMLRPGGRMVYSTCTFAPEEDEGSVHRFLERHPDCQIAEGIDSEGFIHDKEGCIRLFPHKIEGEGHFAAVITKADEGYGGFGLTEKGIKEKDCPEYLSFVKENLKEKPQGALLKFGEQLYLMPEGFPALKGLKVLRPGLHLGTLKKNRFEPSHALALAMQPQEAFHVAMLSSGSQEIRQYLMGQTFSWGGEKGWYLICVDGYSIGWGKLAGGIMKNHYPKGLRMVDII